MKIKLFLIIILCTFGSLPLSASERLDSLLDVLDRTIANHQFYKGARDTRIKALKADISRMALRPEAHYLLNKRLYEEYKPYICDSAIAYLNNNIQLASLMKSIDHLDESKILLSYQLSSSGMYMESIDLLRSINRNLLPPHLLIQYFTSYDHAYGEMGFYSQDKSSGQRYIEISNNYKDSLYKLLDPKSEQYLSMKETVARDKKDYALAMHINEMRLTSTEFGTHQYAIVMFYRALIYGQTGDTDNEMQCLALSSISDIQSAIMDHASLWTLANALYEKGDIERAYRYIRFSWDETKLYNARLRSIQSAGTLSLIDNTFQSLIEQKNHKLQNYLVLISILFIGLTFAFIYIRSQYKKLSVIKNSLQKANNQLQKLNHELVSTNDELIESNQIKEEYIARFLKLCSTYIDKLDAYRRMVNKKILSGQTNELYKITHSPEVLDRDLEELYTNFDSAFLHLFPNFVNQINDLLEDDGKVILKKDELLNTELRIFALIRLGIDDSSQIAEFLRYSVNTIYNYRSKIKNKACVERNIFEDMVKKIH